MEVHHHAHTSRKKWTHYFWEFLMLFLAVFCGFLAEYQLEHKIEKDREKVFIKSMGEDVAKDTLMLTNVIKRAKSVAIHIDTLLGIFQKQQLDGPALITAYRVNLKSLQFFGPSFTDRTTVQLKNSGSVRLIRKKEVADAIVDYWSMADGVAKANDLLEDYKLRARDKSYSIFNQAYYLTDEKGMMYVQQINLQLMTKDNFIITEYANRLSHIRNLIVNVYLPLLASNKETSLKLILLLKDKYHLK